MNLWFMKNKRKKWVAVSKVKAKERGTDGRRRWLNWKVRRRSVQPPGVEKALISATEFNGVSLAVLELPFFR
ncbi:hypothetical protein U1Q18_038131 [Sarracenia purpurea var. burkii]